MRRETSDDRKDYGFPAMAVPKPGADGYRLVVDYSRLSDVIENDDFPLLNFADFPIPSSCLMSIEDSRKAYNQLSIAVDSQPYLRVVTPIGCFIPQRLLPGVKTGTSSFQRAVVEISKTEMAPQPGNTC